MHVNGEFINFALQTKQTNTKFRDDPRRRWRSGPAGREAHRVRPRDVSGGHRRPPGSVADPEPNSDLPDPHVFGPPGSGSGSISQKYGSGSFYH